MNTLRNAALAVLDRVRVLLTTEPARLIGYGAAVIVTLVAQFLSSRGYVRFDGITFEASVGLVFGAISFLIVLVESIRRFVYSPQTYIEDLADEYADAFTAGHIDAHEELEPVIQQAFDAGKNFGPEQPPETNTTSKVAFPVGDAPKGVN